MSYQDIVNKGRKNKLKGARFMGGGAVKSGNDTDRGKGVFYFGSGNGHESKFHKFSFLPLIFLPILALFFLSWNLEVGIIFTGVVLIILLYCFFVFLAKV